MTEQPPQSTEIPTSKEQGWLSWTEGKSTIEVARKMSELDEELLKLREKVSELGEEAKLAGKDRLTGLYNRYGILNQQEHINAERVRDKKKVFVIFADLDDLKRVNDAGGHSEGDKLLISTADCMKKTARESDYVVRWGGDEFLVIGEMGQEDTPAVLENRLREAFVQNGISVSLGSAEWHADKPIEEAINLADSLQYEEKKRKKGIR